MGCRSICTRAQVWPRRARVQIAARSGTTGSPQRRPVRDGLYFHAEAMGALSDDERQPLGGAKAAHGCRSTSLFRMILIETVICLVWACFEIVNVILKVLEVMYRLFDACVGLLQPKDPPRHVVIVGASFGGLAAQRELSGRRDVKVTLIDFKRYFEYTPGVPLPPCAASRVAVDSRISPLPEANVASAPCRTEKRTGRFLCASEARPSRAHRPSAVSSSPPSSASSPASYRPRATRWTPPSPHTHFVSRS